MPEICSVRIQCLASSPSLWNHLEIHPEITFHFETAKGVLRRQLTVQVPMRKLSTTFPTIKTLTTFRHEVKKMEGKTKITHLGRQLLGDITFSWWVKLYGKTKIDKKQISKIIKIFEIHPYKRTGDQFGA